MLHLQAIGNIGADAEKKEINGKSYSSFRMGTHARLKDDTTWVSVLVGFREGLHAYLKKGAQVYVSGDMKVSIYARRDGTSAVDVSCFASAVELCGGGINTQPEENNGADGKTTGNNSGFEYLENKAKEQQTDLPF